MIICLIAEGSYPYVTGGVSSWIHQLMQGLPQYKFKIISLMPSQKEELKQRYKLPKNLINIRTIYLDDYLKLQHKFANKKIRLSKRDKENIIKFVNMNPDCDWKRIINFFNKKKKSITTIDFLQSDLFWQIVIDMYNEKYEDEVLNTFFWTLRGMLLPFLHLFQQDLIKADIYHAVSTGYSGILGLYFKLMNNKPFVLTEHGIYAREREEEIIKAKWVTGIYKKLWIDFFYFLSSAAYKEADKIISLFERNRDIQIQLGAPSRKTQVIANGVDFKRFSKLEKEEHKGYNVGAILRIVPIKDVMTLIRAFKIVKNNIKDATLYLIGPTDEDPEYYQQCVDLVSLLQLEKDIIFTGRADIREYIKKIDVLVLTSVSEGQPLVILEGMASGTPIVATDVGSCRELLEEDDNEDACGFITNLVSPNEIATQIIRLLKSPETRQQMGENGKKRVEREYKKIKFITSYREIYEELR